MTSSKKTYMCSTHYSFVITIVVLLRAEFCVLCGCGCCAGPLLGIVYVRDCIVCINHYFKNAACSA